MLAVQNDDAAAFEELVLRYQGRLVSVLRHLVTDLDIAEDLAQEVFLRIYRARKNYKPTARFAPWLFTIANNVALNLLRTKKRRPEMQYAPAAGPDESGANRTIGDLLEAASATIPTRALDKLEMKEMVRIAVEALGERQRMAVLLHKFEGMSYNEIAEVMDMTPQGVKSLLCRARMNLRDLLQPYLDKGEHL